MGGPLGGFLLGLRGRFFLLPKAKNLCVSSFPTERVHFKSLLWDLKSSTRDQNQHPPAVEGSSLNHWTAKEFPYFKSFKLR